MVTDHMQQFNFYLTYVTIYVTDEEMLSGSLRYITWCISDVEGSVSVRTHAASKRWFDFEYLQYLYIVFLNFLMNVSSIKRTM